MVWPRVNKKKRITSKWSSHAYTSTFLWMRLHHIWQKKMSIMFSVSVRWRRGGLGRSLTVWTLPRSPQTSDAGVGTRPPSPVRESHSSPTGSRHLSMKVQTYPQLKNMHVFFLFVWDDIFSKVCLKEKESPGNH